jgi:trehalose 6-phosphate synthase/phosphatase
MVISGRGRPDLDRWLGDIPGLWLAAEHGAFVRPQNAAWRSPEIPQLDWKDRIRPILSEFTARTPGSFIEEKEYCLVWHFRNADPETAEPRSQELMVRVEGALFGSAILTMPGHKIVEIKPSSLHKGTVVDVIMREHGPAGFWLAAGDDRTDEDLFAALPCDSWTIRVGAGHSRARFALAGPVQINALLSDMSMLGLAGGTNPL